MFQSILLISALAASAFAQASGTSISASSITSTATQSMPAVATQGFNPNNVTRALALQWCTAQRNTCTDICTGRTSSNSCNEATFVYSCTCTNGTIPDCSAFQQSLPYYICEETYIQCMNANPSTNPEGQQVCINNRQCGTRNATAERGARAVTTSGASSVSSAASASGSAATAASSSSSRAAADSTVTSVTTGAFAALLFALARLAL